MNLLYMRARAKRAHTQLINYRSIPKTNTKQYWRYAYKLIKEKKEYTTAKVSDKIKKDRVTNTIFSYVRSLLQKNIKL